MSRERSTNYELWESVECRQNDPELWFLDTTDVRGAGLSPDQVNGLKVALTICNRCPLRVECLTLGMADEDRPYGIWGGLMPGERYQLAKETRFKHHRYAIERAKTIRKLTGVSQP